MRQYEEVLESWLFNTWNQQAGSIIKNTNLPPRVTQLLGPEKLPPSILDRRIPTLEMYKSSLSKDPNALAGYSTGELQDMSRRMRTHGKIFRGIRDASLVGGGALIFSKLLKKKKKSLKQRIFEKLGFK